MTWDDIKKFDLLINSKTLTVFLAITISRKSDIGHPIDGYLDDFYLISNVTFSIEESSSILTDLELDFLNSIYSKIYTKHNRYKGLKIPAHHNDH